MSTPVGESVQTSTPVGEPVQTSTPVGEPVQTSIPVGEPVQMSTPVGESVQTSTPVGESVQTAVHSQVPDVAAQVEVLNSEEPKQVLGGVKEPGLLMSSLIPFLHYHLFFCCFLFHSIYTFVR